MKISQSQKVNSRWINTRNSTRPITHEENWEYDLNLKDFLTTSSNLLPNKLRQSREWVPKSKNFKNKGKNLCFYPTGTVNSGLRNRSKRIYNKPQSAKRSNLTLKSENIYLYQNKLAWDPKLKMASRNIQKQINPFHSHPMKNHKYVINYKS